MSTLSNKKTVLITGASSGIGEHTAYEAAFKGHNLILSARRLDKLEEVKLVCEELGADVVIAHPLDIANPDSVDALVQFIKDEEIIVDVLVNNAGFGHSDSFATLDFQVVTDIFQVNVIGLMYLTQQLAILMLDQGEGQIINVASLAGKVSTPRYTVYGATKGAIISFSNALRLELKPFNIQVTTVNFGPVDTPFFDQIERSKTEMAKNSPFTLTGYEAGEIVADAIGTNKREINRPLTLAIGAKIYQMVPTLGDYVLTNYLND